MVQTTLRLPKKLYQDIKEMAKIRGMTVNGFVVSVLWEVIDGNRLLWEQM